MNRDVPFRYNEFCDVCGTAGAFDFMGDYLCPECLKKWTEDESRNTTMIREGADNYTDPSDPDFPLREA